MLLFDINQKKAAEICKTKEKGWGGTSTMVAIPKLQEAGVKCSEVYIGKEFRECVWWLEALSLHYPIILCGSWREKSGKGRPAHLCHAVLLADGYAYDPAFSEGATPIQALEHNRDVSFTVNSIVIFEEERLNFGSTNFSQD